MLKVTKNSVKLGPVHPQIKAEIMNSLTLGLKPNEVFSYMMVRRGIRRQDRKKIVSYYLSYLDFNPHEFSDISEKVEAWFLWLETNPLFIYTQMKS